MGCGARHRRQTERRGPQGGDHDQSAGRVSHLRCPGRSLHDCRDRRFRHGARVERGGAVAGGAGRKGVAHAAEGSRLGTAQRGCHPALRVPTSTCQPQPLPEGWHHGARPAHSPSARFRGPSRPRRPSRPARFRGPGHLRGPARLPRGAPARRSPADRPPDPGAVLRVGGSPPLPPGRRDGTPDLSRRKPGAVRTQAHRQDARPLGFRAVAHRFRWLPEAAPDRRRGGGVVTGRRQDRPGPPGRRWQRRDLRALDGCRGSGHAGQPPDTVAGGADLVARR